MLFLFVDLLVDLSRVVLNWSMRNHLISSIVVLIGFIGAISVYKIYDRKLTEGQNAPQSLTELKKFETDGLPDFVIETRDGQKKKMADYKGKLVLLNLWASWCPPCVTEFPSMVKLAKKFEKDMVVVAISQDTDKQELDSFLKQQGYLGSNFVVGVDYKKEMIQVLNLVALPETFILDREGKLIRKVSGVEDWYSPDAIQFFEGLVK